MMILQRQNKLISSERMFKILQNGTKIIKIGQAVFEIWTILREKNDRKTENVVFLKSFAKTEEQ